LSNLIRGEKPGTNGGLATGPFATRIANQQTDRVRFVDHESDLDTSAEAWARLGSAIEASHDTEVDAQTRGDEARWQQAEIVAGLYGRWGHDGLTIRAIATRFGESESTIKVYVGMYRKFAGRKDLAGRRFWDWRQVFDGIQSELRAVDRMVTDKDSRKKLKVAIDNKLPDVVGKVVADEALKTNRDLRVKTKKAVKGLLLSEHTRLFPPPKVAGAPIRLMDGVDLLAEQEDGSVSVLILDAPYGTSANPRGIKMANNTPVEARDLLMRIAPIISRKLTGNGFVFWFRPGFDVDPTDRLKPILAEHLSMRQLIWFKTKAGLSPSGTNIGSCYESIFLLWPKNRSQPVPHRFLPDCLHVSHDGESGPNSEHPSAKPVALFEKLIAVTTLPRDLVVDPFTGTGAAVAAALKLERQAVAAEIVPEILQLAKERLTECRADLASDPITAAFAAERGIETL
jgi:DNA methylase